METTCFKNPDAQVTRKSISVSKKILEDKYVRECFQDHLGTQIYVQISATHIRSEQFSRAILAVIRYIRRHPPKKLESFVNTFRLYGGRDAAATNPWYDRPTWRTGTSMETLIQEAEQKRDRRMQELMDAAYNTKPNLAWKIVWIE